MPAFGLWHARIGYRDREGTVDYMNLYFDRSNSPSALLTGLAADGRFAAVSECTICSVEVSQTIVYQPVMLPTKTGLRWGTMVFATDAGGYGLLDIPGCVPELTMQTGCFAGRALDVAAPELTELAVLVTHAPTLITPGGEAYVQLVAGGLRDVWSEPTRRSG